MKKTRFASIFVAALAVTAFSGCASQGGVKGTFSKVGQTVGEVAGKAVSVAKDVGGKLVPGDYVTGVHVNDEALASLKPGMRASEVEAVIGMAPDVTPSSQGEVWKYPYARIPHFGENVNETTVVRFDARGRMTKAYKVQGGGAAASGNPLLQAAEAQGQL